MTYSIDFESPAYLFLLALLPAIWFLGRGGLAGLGRFRGFTAALLRTAVFVLLVLALAEFHVVRTSDRTAVMYVVDASLSIAPDEFSKAAKFIAANSERFRDAQRGDMAGVIVFARQPAIEIPPIENPVSIQRVEAPIDPRHTDLASALRLAGAALPEDCARRIVVITDGNQNLGDADDEARRLAAAGVGIDVVPIRSPARSEVIVEKVTAPADIRAGTPFDVRVVLDHQSPSANAPPMAGKLQVSRVAGEDRELLVERSVSLPHGKQVMTFRDEMRDPRMFTYEARFVPDDVSRDGFSHNNRATAYVHVRGRGNVLLIEDSAKPDQAQELAETLREAEISVTRVSSRQPFSDLAELQQYDAVVLSDVPRTSGETADDLSNFTDRQLDMLVRNTQQLGGGLVMLGGPDSFGAGGWANTPIEAAMPVDFHVDNLKVVPAGALVLVIDRSGSMDGEKLAMSKSAAIEALKVLGERDYVAVYAFDSEPYTIVPFTQVGKLRGASQRIASLGSGGGTDMKPAMVMGYQELLAAEAAVKHMIVLSDGQTNGDGFEQLARDMLAAKITTTTVAVGADSDTQLMQGIAQAGSGKFYQVHQPGALPRIFMREARRVSRPVVFEDSAGISSNLAYPHEILAGVGDLPPFTGYVLTTVKSSPLVEVALLASKPASTSNAILASWTYGLGRCVAFTTDTGQRWTKGWSEWQGRDKLLVQMIRWAMRPTNDGGRFTVATEVMDGRAKIAITALDQNDDFLNFLPLEAVTIGPDLEARTVELSQVSPGRYVGEFAADEAGSHFVSISPGQGMAPLRVGVNVPYSREFTRHGANEGLLSSLAAVQPQGGKAGVEAELASSEGAFAADSVDPFRGGLANAGRRTPIWPLLALAAACVFVADVFHRRVSMGLDWLWALRAKWRAWWTRRLIEPAAANHLDRLRDRKQQVGEELAARGQANRFEPAAAASASQPEAAAELEKALGQGDTATAVRAPSTPVKPKPDEASYTERLLQAKQKVWRDRDRNPH